MPLDFPSSPTNGQYYNGFVYNAANETWDSAYAPRAATIPISSPNVIINGGFDIWQRGTSFAGISSLGFSADRWKALHANGARTVSRQSFTSGELESSGFGSPEFYLRWQQTTNSTSGENDIAQEIEDVRTLAGQAVTVSFWAKANKAISTTLICNQYFGSGGSSTVFNAISNTAPSFNVSTSWQRFTYTGVLASVSGKTIGSNSFTRLAFRLPFNDTYTFDVWGVQVEAGAAATDFRRNAPSIQAELAACQRYYYRRYSETTNGAFGFAFGDTTTVAYVNIQHPVIMRTIPSSTLDWTTSAANYMLYGTATVGSLSNIVIVASQSSSSATNLQVTGTSVVAGRPYILMSQGVTGAYIGFSAEL